MALKYTTLDNLNTYLGTSGVDSLMTLTWELAESLFDTLVWWGIESKNHTQVFKAWYSGNTYHEGRIFYLSANNITSITTIGWVSAGTIDVDYVIDLQRLEFESARSFPNNFPYQYKIVFVAWFSTIPDDVKLAVNTIASVLYNTRNANGIASYKQDLLSVNYKDSSILDTITDPEAKGFIQNIVNKYKIHTVLS